jgi:mono/diheme cytochrome c family protein
MLRYKLFVSIIVILSFSFNKQINSTVVFFRNDNNIIQKQNTQIPPKAELGKDIYQKHCLSCHQVNGSGVPNMYPPLQKSDWVNGAKNRIISVVLNGIKGEILVNDDTYRSVMPKQDYLTDEQIAKVLTYIRQNFENKASEVKPAEVTKLRIPKTK